jgi:hypothetical protein
VATCFALAGEAHWLRLLWQIWHTQTQKATSTKTAQLQKNILLLSIAYCNNRIFYIEV